MRTLPLTNLFLLFALVPFFFSCEKELPDPPIADFNCTYTNANGNVSVTFSDLSTNNPNKWEWSFSGGEPYTSNEQNPTVIYKAPGSFDVKLIASNDGGSNEIIKEAHINIARLVNDLPTEAVLTIGDITKTFPSKSNNLFLLFDLPEANWHVETTGYSANGEPSGLLIYWDAQINLVKDNYFQIGLPKSFVFFNVTNTTGYTFTYFHTNCGNPDYETFEEVIIPSDGIKYGIGYYFAKVFMEVRAYSADGYISKTEAKDFYLPWEYNQSFNLKFTKTNKTEYDDNSNLTIISPKINHSNIITKEEQGFEDDNSNIRHITLSKIK